MEEAIVEGWVDIGTAGVTAFLALVVLCFAGYSLRKYLQSDDNEGWLMGVVFGLLGSVILAVVTITFLREGIVAVVTGGS